MSNQWSVSSLGNLKGTNAIVTGANSGLGYETALELGKAGAAVVIACRDPLRAADALAKLKAAAPEASFRLESLDLADLSSVRGFAERFLKTGVPLDLLVNNAGVMALPKRELTTDGFERQFATNHLGHFALTGLLLPALKAARHPRVVTVSSLMALIGKIDFDNLQSEKRYGPARTYGTSKLANLLFMEELGRRAPWLLSVAAHPGGSTTNLQRYDGFSKVVVEWVGQSAWHGAMPSLRAASEQVASGTFYGPRWGMRGAAVIAKAPKRAHDLAVATALWDASEKLTDVHYNFAETAGQAAA